jgi:hypothetical protein
MTDFFINIFLDDEKTKQIAAAELTDKIQDIDGKKAVQVKMNEKDQKKLLKGYPGLLFDASNACVLPADGEEKLMQSIVALKSMDVIKEAIKKLYNPLAGRDVFGRGSGAR